MCSSDLAKGEDGEAVVRVAAAETEEALAEADGEDFNADATELGYGEVAEFVDQNHDAKDDGKLDDCRHERSRNLVLGGCAGLS